MNLCDPNLTLAAALLSLAQATVTTRAEPIAVVFVVPAPAVDLSRLVLAIEIREGNAWSAPGGRLGFKRETWEQFSTLPFRFASHPAWSRYIAKHALQSYAERLRAEGYVVTAQRLAACWRWGYSGAKRRWPDDYPEHVANLATSEIHER
jgi:hypothetical protein